MATIKFEVPGKPQGKGRPVFGRPRGTFVTTRTPDKTLLYENWIKLCYPCGESPFTGAVRLRVMAYYQIPKSKSTKVKALMACGAVRPTVKPDLDNIVKVLKDALNGLAWDDDKQVVELFAQKFYSYDPRLEVEIEEIV